MSSSAPAVRQSAREILLSAIQVVVGRDSDVARYLVKAMSSDDPLDLLLAQAAFDELEGPLKRAVAQEIESGSRAYRNRLRAA